MIARLWWKEARLFWPIWVFIALAALAGQGLALDFAPDDARAGLLPAMALGWACLYACAVASAAFAGEREVKTLAFLDTLPVGRGTLWGGKFSFAFGSTLALAGVVLSAAAYDTVRWEVGEAGPWVVGLAFASVLAEVIGWGLLWSSVTRTALTAAVLAVCCTAFTAPIASRFAWNDSTATTQVLTGVEPTRLVAASYPLVVLVGPTPIRFALAALTSLISAGLMTAPPRRPLLRRRARPKTRDRSILFQPVSLPIARVRWEVPAWFPPARRLAWQARREIGWGWLGMVGLGLVFPWLQSGGRLVSSEFLLFNALVALWAGVKVFGSESRVRGQRFLTHHGARPSLVWLTKIGVWSVALFWLSLPAALYTGRLLWIAWENGGTLPIMAPAETRPVLWMAAVADAFTVALVCGMAIKRGITAAVASAGALTVLGFAETALYEPGMLGAGFLAWPPVILLFASWAWSRDWLYEPPGAGRWVRLALLLAVPFAAMAAYYVADRAWGLPPVAEAARDGFDSPGAPDDASDLYREADRLLAPGEAVLDKSAGALELVRKASRKSTATFVRPGSRTVSTPIDLPDLSRLSRLLAASARNRIDVGDLDGAWADVADLFRMARQWSGPVPLAVFEKGLDIDGLAAEVANAWLSAKGQTPDRLRKALDDLKALRPTREALAGPIEGEAAAVDRMLRQPAATVRDAYLQHVGDAGRYVSPFDGAAAIVSTTPWEIERARRAFALLFESALDEARLEPYKRSAPVWSNGFGMVVRAKREVGFFLPGISLAGKYARVAQTTPLVKVWFPNVVDAMDRFDHAETARRALEQLVAIRIWQLTHGGKSPGSLAELVPSVLDALPADPYRGRPFGYVVSSGQSFWGISGASASDRDFVQLFGRRLLYSIGRDRRDDHASSQEARFQNGRGDILYLVPPGSNDPLPDLPPETFAPMPDGDDTPDAIMGAASGRPLELSGGTAVYMIPSSPPAPPVTLPPAAPR